MTIADTAPAPPAQCSTANEVSLFRLYVLRALYLLLVIGGGIVFVPQLIVHDPAARGVIPSLLGALWLLAFFGLRYPLQMLPLLLFELIWKMIWLIDFGLPQYISGQRPATFADDFSSIAFAPLLFIPALPWAYIWRHYVKQPGTRWR